MPEAPSDFVLPHEISLMERALELARRGLGRTSPNPMVGAVLASSDGTVLGEGWHPGPGQPHAEIFALRDAQRQGHTARISGATMVVTLEPCCHHGRTGPCTEAILQAGLGRVIAAMTDPNPQVAGQGFHRLKTAGLSVVTGVLEKEASELNPGFLRYHQEGRPQVTAKWAMTLDGRIATANRSSQWITSEAARHHVHQQRAYHDGILTGIGTLLADDPLLTVRLPDPQLWPVRGVEPIQPLRIIVDGQLRTPLEARLLTEESLSAGPVLFLTGRLEDASAAEPYRQLGATVVEVPQSDRPHYVDLRRALEVLARDHAVLSVYLEAGPGILGAFLGADLVDRCHVYVAPKLAGGDPPQSPTRGWGREPMDQALTLATPLLTQSFPPDLFLQGDIHPLGSGWLDQKRTGIEA
jgi:diaminohydroxyphosphoribosylaminopyrimidine deaminase/5-amino-6-(5-phosphoribosylamino)uracil reductase